MYLLDVHLENGKAPRRDRRDEGLPGEESGDVLADQADSRNGLSVTVPTAASPDGTSSREQPGCTQSKGGNRLFTGRVCFVRTGQNGEQKEPRTRRACCYTEVGGRVCVDFVEGIGDPNGNSGVKSMLTGTDQNSNKTGRIAAPPNSKIHDLLQGSIAQTP